MARHRFDRRRRIVPGVESLEGRTLLSSAPRAILTGRAAELSTSHSRGLPAPTAARWAWLANTYWYVPTPNLPATIYNTGTGTLVPVLDQTVYHITGYRSGYFWGQTVTQFGTAAPTSSALVGSVTPQGRVLLMFTSSASSVEGYGVMIRPHGQWTMENQMFSSTSSGTQVGHWACMAQTRPGQSSWRALPGVGVSVPQFLSAYSAPVPTPVSTP